MSIQKLTVALGLIALCVGSAGAQSNPDAMLILSQNALDADGSRLIMLNGPDDATIKSLDELETRIVLMPPGPDDMLPVSATAVISINSAGSYVLGGNVFGVAGKNGIEIKKSNVTLDLNGYAVIGTPDALSGINVPNGVVNVKIHNGAIRGWPQRGIDGKKMSASEVSDVRVGNCKWHGIFIGDGIVSNCTSRLNGGDGINVSKGMSVVRGCTVERNGGDGVDVNFNTTICKVTATGNTGSGITCGNTCIVTGCIAADNGSLGISGNHECKVIECTARNNSSVGINLSLGGVVRGCDSYTNGSLGIQVSNGGAVSESVAWNNDGAGIHASTGSRIADCTSYSNQNFGISADAACIVDSCVSYNNVFRGIVVGNASTVSGCTVTTHGGANEHGIHATGDSVITGNTCDGNTIGIVAVDSGSRVEGNNVTDGTTGIMVTAAGNIVVRNSVSCTTDFDIVPGNKVGGISSDPSTAGPWDNFDF